MEGKQVALFNRYVGSARSRRLDVRKRGHSLFAKRKSWRQHLLKWGQREDVILFEPEGRYRLHGFDWFSVKMRSGTLIHWRSYAATNSLLLLNEGQDGNLNTAAVKGGISSITLSCQNESSFFIYAPGASIAHWLGGPQCRAQFRQERECKPNRAYACIFFLHGTLIAVIKYI